MADTVPVRGDCPRCQVGLFASGPIVLCLECGAGAGLTDWQEGGHLKSGMFSAAELDDLRERLRRGR